MINSKKKGSKGELELANKLKNEYGFNCRRTQQFCGKGGESADVIKIKLKDIAKLQHLYIEIFTKEDEELKSKLENKDKYFELIIGLGYDYDGYYNREISNGNIKGLADLMDELVQAARDGLNDIPYQK